MKKTLWNTNWFCIICSKPLPNHCLDENDDFDNSGVFPNVEGGTFRLHFGYGSRNDQLESMLNHRQEEYIGCICDNCFDDKRSLMKLVIVKESKKFIIRD